MILTPQKKIELMRTYEMNPSVAILNIIELLRTEIKEVMRAEIEKIKENNALEIERLTVARLQEVIKELKKEIPDMDKILQTIKGNDGEDAEAIDVAETLLEMPEFIRLTKAEDGKTPTEEQLLTLIKPLIPILRQPEDGKTPSEYELLALMKPLIPIVENGHTPTVEELTAIIKPLIPNVRDGSPDTGKEIVSKINELPITPDLQIDASHIKNLPRISKKLGKAIIKGSDGTSTGGVGAWSTPVETITAPSTTLIFTVGASAPTDVIADGMNYYEGKGYTYAAGQITFDQAPQNYVRYR